MTGFDDPVAMVAALPVFLVPLVVFASSMLEYVFPPYWGDTLILVGFFLARQGAVSWLAVFVAAVAGALLGATIAFFLGKRYGLRVLRRFARRRSRSRARVQALFRRYGEPVLLLNRFLPVVRGLMLYAAGAMELRARPALVYATLGSTAWVAMMMGIGWLTGGTWDQLQATFAESSKAVALAALVVFVGWLAWLLKRYLEGRGSDPGDAGGPGRGEPT